MNVNELGAAIDNLYKTREARLLLEKDTKALKAKEVQLRGEIRTCLEASGLAKASGQSATCGITKAWIPIVSDWNLLYKYIAQNDRFDLLQKRVSSTAWRDTYDNGVLIPGTEAVEDIDISLTKSTR